MRVRAAQEQTELEVDSERSDTTVERITIIGMGPIGMSIGLGLKAAGLTDTEVLGTSGDRKTLNYGKEIGAFDEISSNLRSALRGAQMVILDSTLGEARELMEAIGPILEEDCLVTDTGFAKVKMMEWAAEYLPDNVEFVAGRPVSKEYMKTVEDATADAFDEGIYCIVTSRKTSQSAVKTVVGLAELLGAKPLFLDEHEHDSYTSAASHLPVLLSSALVNSVSAGPAWREIARVGGGEFGLVAELSSGDAEDNALACLSSPDTTIRWLDQAIEELTAYRAQIEAGGEELGRSFDKALDEWARWKTDTVVTSDAPDLPSAGETMSGLFFGRHISKRFRDLTKDDGADGSKR